MMTTIIVAVLAIGGTVALVVMLLDVLVWSSRQTYTDIAILLDVRTKVVSKKNAMMIAHAKPVSC